MTRTAMSWRSRIVTAIDESLGRLDLVSNQQQVQVTLSAAARGNFAFRYTVTDGRGGTATATVTVTVRTAAENSAPEQVRQTPMFVAQRGRATASVLGDWVDPDGDPFYLASAETAPPDTVSHRPEGSVVFVEGGAASGDRVRSPWSCRTATPMGPAAFGSR